jgi:tRNA A37 methylthiotransferase MiaB
MVGFPGESEEDFLETVDFVRQARFLDCHVFAYSKRHGTPAAEFDNQVSENIKRERSERLIRECAAVRDEVLDGIIASGENLSCIFETREGEYFTGHSDTFVPVRVKNTNGEDLRGQMRYVTPVSKEDGVIFGNLI